MATQKPSKKQLAARKLFAQRSRAGTLKKPISRPSQATGKRPSSRLKARREKSIPGYFANPVKPQFRIENVEDVLFNGRSKKAFELFELNGDSYTFVGAYSVPARMPRKDWIDFALMDDSDFDKKVSRKRKSNPLENNIQKVGRKIAHFRYLVETRPYPTSKWRTVAGFMLKPDAATYAQALHKLMPGLYIHVEDCE
jgi:hypothetical protein